MDDSEFSKLLDDITENPELVLSTQLTDKQILELQKRINPYSHITTARDPTGAHKKVAVASYTNLREDYQRRFVMTSLIGFLYRMMKEYEVPVESRRWTPKKEASENPFKLDELIERLEAVLELAKRGQAENVSQDDYDDAVFGVTNVLFLLGEEAKLRFPRTLQQAKNAPITKELLEKFPDKIKKMSQGSSIEVPPSLAKNMISQFIDTLFSYDPNVHVKSAKGKSQVDDTTNVDLVDPDRVTLEKLQKKATADLSDSNDANAEALSTIFASKLNYNAASAVLNNKSLLDAVQYMAQHPDHFDRHLKNYLDDEVKTVINVIPPQDTFHRWGYYTEVNYEDLRKATEAIYFDKPDLDWALALLETFEGSQTDIDNKFEAYKSRYQDEMLTDIKLIEFGGWTLLGDFKENRKNMDFYNKNMGILKRIIDRHTEDKAIGKELMKNRVVKSKAKNIAEHGPDAPGLKDYKATMGATMESFGAQKAISTEEMKRLEAARGNIKVAKELEYIDDLRKTVNEMEERLDELTLNEKDMLEVKKKELVRAVELLEVPEDAIQVDVFTNDGEDLKKTSFYTKSDEILEKEYNEKMDIQPAAHPTRPAGQLGPAGSLPGPAGRGAGRGASSAPPVMSKLTQGGQELNINDLAPFARAFYEKSNGTEDMKKYKFVEEVIVREDGVEESKGGELVET
jgi:hypothetical protein